MSEADDLGKFLDSGDTEAEHFADFLRPQASAAESLTGGIAEGLADNALGVPQILSNTLSRMDPRTLPGIPGTPVAPPQIPSGREALAGLQGLLPGQTTAGAMAEREAAQAANPGMHTVGRFGADIGTLATGRLPRTGPGGMFDDAIERATKLMSEKLVKAKPAEFGFRKIGDDFLQNPTFQATLRGMGRSVETGVEGAALELLQDGDPLETAAYAAGGQIVASGSLAIAEGVASVPFKMFDKNLPKGTISRALIGLTASAALGTTLLQLGQNVTPGGENSPIEAEQDAWTKMTGALLLGMFVGLPGKRPRSGGMLDRLPSLADAILTVPRTAIINLAQFMADDPAVSKVVASMATHPEAFKPDQLRRWNNDIQNNEGAGLQKLWEEFTQDQSFVDIIEAPLAAMISIPRKDVEEDGPVFGGRVRNRRRRGEPGPVISGGRSN